MTFDTAADYPVRISQQVRWSDVDMYGHVNNIIYYGWFDTAINSWLLTEAGVDPVTADAIGVVGESACSYESEVILGDDVTIGLAVADEIMNLHHGSLNIESGEGVGTTVTLTLPVYKEGAENMAETKNIKL